ncbi:MAG: ADP-glyceromanno-heptose 6-epimerase [Chitinophagaceae bacterium]|nr:ADP-glyceromanno-heptose 6-epimerase [Chitinophagaceae bacterium]MBP9104293.1 ADP-glyceromanno-heptose 6-epimerase [Chitinophagaceae bacterium]
MEKNKTILLTGAAGFIGSHLLGFLNKQGYANIIIVDEFDNEDKWFNFDDKQFTEKVERSILFDWLKENNPAIDFVFHLGARTDTTEFDYSIHEKLNVEYSKNIWNYCTEKSIPLVYASSAATYGSGELGYKDDHAIVNELQPLNPYGISKNEFDKWALQQTSQPPSWAGLKFFNVYGPNEYHKGRMASMIFHGYNQIKKTGEVKLFKSHKPEFKDGEQLRDFIYVEDIAKVCYWLMQNNVESGLYNLGTGKARSFKDQITAIFNTLNKEPNIQYIDMPEDIRDKYQYFTEADMSKLINAGYTESFYSLEEGVADYVKNFLAGSNYY